MGTKMEIIEAIRSSVLTPADCHQIFDAVNIKLRQLHDAAASNAILTLRPGMSVSFGDKSRRGKGGYKEGIITEIKKTKIVVEVDGLGWAVPAEHVKVLDKKVEPQPKEKCPTCQGSGKQSLSVKTFGSKDSEPPMVIDCVLCHGKGVVNKSQLRLLEQEKAMWCRCEKPSEGTTFHDDGECRQCRKHHYHCENCGKITQVG